MSKQPQFMACPTCGCTDIQGAAWVYVNTSEFADGDPPIDDMYCDRCGYEGREGTFRRCAWVTELDPFIRDDEEVSS